MSRLIDFKTDDGVIWIAAAHIVSIQAQSTGGVTIKLVNGEIHATGDLKFVLGRIEGARV